MKKTLLKISALALTLLMTFATSCNDNKADKAADNKAPEAKEEVVLPNYRYVEIDSVLVAYNLAKDYNEEMLRMQTNLENTIRQRESQIIKKEQEMQKKYQNNGYLTEESVRKDQEDFAKMQTNAQNEIAKLQNNLMKATEESKKTVLDSISSYIREYNKKYGYDAIFIKEVSMLYVDTNLNITKDIIVGLNSRYNKITK